MIRTSLFARLPVAGWLSLVSLVALTSAALAYRSEQASQGAVVYLERCSTCHGDVGQGLTDEFRATWAPGDQNCWIPACHGGNPPKPGGFTIPRTVPAVAGPGTLGKFATAQALHDFMRAAMPYQEPGVLSDDDYWALTAYLLRQNGVPADDRLLDAATAGSVAVPRSGQPVPKSVLTPNVTTQASQAASMRGRSVAPPIATPTETPATAGATAIPATAAIALMNQGKNPGPTGPEPLPPLSPAATSASPTYRLVWPAALVALVAVAGAAIWLRRLRR